MPTSIWNPYILTVILHMHFTFHISNKTHVVKYGVFYKSFYIFYRTFTKWEHCIRDSVSDYSHSMHQVHPSRSTNTHVSRAWDDALTNWATQPGPWTYAYKVIHLLPWSQLSNLKLLSQRTCVGWLDELNFINTVCSITLQKCF